MKELQGLFRNAKLTRRRLLHSAVAFAGTAALAACSDQKEKPQNIYFPTDPNTTRPLNYNPPTDPVTSLTTHEGEINSDYVRMLLAELSNKSESSSSTEHAQAVIQNTAEIIKVDFKEQKGRHGGTAVMIDKGGYFLTASHVIEGKRVKLNEYAPETSAVSVFIPQTGEFVKAEACIVDPEIDIAIVHAPTGKTYKPVENLAISYELPQNNDPAWMYALVAQYENPTAKQFLAFLAEIRTGRVEYKKNNLPPNLDYPDWYLAVRGLTPYAGASGAPVINKDGRIIGIETSVMPYEGEHDIKTYPGALIVKADTLKRVIQNGQIHKFI